VLNQVISRGLRDWHAFWTPVKAWADHHQDHNGNALQFLASLATIIGLPILALLVVATLAFLIIDRIDARRQRALQLKAILLGLKTELRGARDTANQDVMALAAGQGATWTILPHTSVEQALIEAGLLALTPEQIVGLHELRLRILKANSLVNANLTVPRSIPGPQGEAFRGRRDRLGRQIQDQFESITGLCDTLLARLDVV
jgi:hypothetical protein